MYVVGISTYHTSNASTHDSKFVTNLQQTVKLIKTT